MAKDRFTKMMEKVHLNNIDRKEESRKTRKFIEEQKRKRESDNESEPQKRSREREVKKFFKDHGEWYEW